MKHSVKVTGVLLLIFVLAQLIGLGVVYNYIDFEKTAQLGKTEFKDLPFGERPPIDEDTSYIPLMIALLLGTVLMLLLLKYNFTFVWKSWFFLAVFLALTFSFNAFIPAVASFIVAFVLTLWKVFKPNFWIQNGTELFIYGGLAAIIVPLLSVFSAGVLLILVAIYDAYAVWKSKHMITLAKSQTKAKVFAGLVVPYVLPKRVKKSNKSKKTKMVKVRTAILGGGDIGFPLVFAGVVLKDVGLWQALVIPFFATLGLGYLFWIANPKKFYPAMPFISSACLIGFGVVKLIMLF